MVALERFAVLMKGAFKISSCLGPPTSVGTVGNTVELEPSGEPRAQYWRRAESVAPAHVPHSWPAHFPGYLHGLWRHPRLYGELLGLTDLAGMRVLTSLFAVLSVDSESVGSTEAIKRKFAQGGFGRASRIKS